MHLSAGLHLNSGEKRVPFSSVAKGGGRGGYSFSPIGLSTKMQNKENTTFLSFLRPLFVLEGLKSDLKHLLKHIFKGGEANLSKTKVTNQ